MTIVSIWSVDLYMYISVHHLYLVSVIDMCAIPAEDVKSLRTLCLVTNRNFGQYTTLVELIYKTNYGKETKSKCASSHENM